ncbi:MAG TPA: hypothetical protein VJW17_14280 [Pyrinomonadaceae bacterium]|nr:hypothetical protein [Pyrinomonadaceae bacterium]
MANFTKKSPAVILSPAVEKKVNEIADVFFDLTKKKIVITDGNRTAAHQAVQVYKKILAHDLTIYTNHKAASQIKAAFDLAQSQGKTNAEIIQAMTRVIENQMKAKVFLSRHLTGKAFDVRNTDMNSKQQNSFKQVVQKVGGATVLSEGKPPHFHVQLA